VIRELVGILLAAVLVLAAGLKLVRPAESTAALRTFGLGNETARRAALAALVVAELAVAGLLVAGVTVGAWMAAGLFLIFAAALGLALWAGRAGAPCACLGPRSTVSTTAVGRALALAAVALTIPFLPDGAASTDTWLGVGLAVAGLAIAALGVAVAALAREIGRLRLALGPETALEMPHEGPALGAVVPELGAAFSPGPQAILALAVFESDGCRMCQQLAPSIDAFAREAVLAVTRFDEVRDAEVWEALDIPGSPFAVVLSLEAVVLAKGTFNSPGQLESLLATAERRAREDAEELHHVG
jgi:hypothetical protein